MRTLSVFQPFTFQLHFTMMTQKKRLVLFFINGPVPTPEEREQGLAIGAAFRNALQVEDGEKPEPCTAVFGAVPKPYLACPRAMLGVVEETVDPEKQDEPIPEIQPEQTAESPVSKLKQASVKKAGKK